MSGCGYVTWRFEVNAFQMTVHYCQSAHCYKTLASFLAHFSDIILLDTNTNNLKKYLGENIGQRRTHQLKRGSLVRGTQRIGDKMALLKVRGRDD